MKKILIPLIISLQFFFIITTGYSADNKVRIYFGNGMLNEEEDALESKDATLELMRYKIQGTNLEGKIIYNISHNPTDNGVIDFLESAMQALDTQWANMWRYLASLDPVPNLLQDQLKEASLYYDQAMVGGYPELQNHVDEYNERLCQGDKVIVVAHSQGNFYANIAYTGINENVINGFGVVSVANPDSDVAGDGPYTTIIEDVFMAQVIGSMPANLSNFSNTNNANPVDWSGHKFIESYLAIGRPAKTKILNDITSTIDRLEWPEGICQQTLLYVDYTPPKGNTMCIVWDINGEKIFEEATKNDGTKATFPIQSSEIYSWLKNYVSLSKPNPISVTERLGDEAPSFSYPNGYGYEGECFVIDIELYEHKLVEGYDETGFTSEYIARSLKTDGIYDGEELIMGKSHGSSSISYPFGGKHSPASFEIESQSNIGGIRGRLFSLKYENEWEDYRLYDVPDSCSAVANNNHQAYSEQTNITYTVKSPFSDRSITTIELNNEVIYSYNDRISKSSFAALDKVLYRFGGVIGDYESPYMILYYTEKIVSMEISNNCVATGGPYSGHQKLTWNVPDGSQYPRSCQTHRPDRALYCPDIPEGYTTHSDKIKVFMGSTTGDPMDLNPFEIPENEKLTKAFESLLLLGEPDGVPYFRIRLLKKN